MAENSWKLLITNVHIEASMGWTRAKVTSVIGGEAAGYGRHCRCGKQTSADRRV